MKKTFLILFLLLYQMSFSQNLVPNWSFEDTISCPTLPAQIDKAWGWSNYRSSPDYFNACNTALVGVPSNTFGFQYAKGGNAYAGFVTYEMAGLYREYLGISLSQSLTIGLKYYLCFYVSKAGYNFVATNKIGAHFSTIAFSNVNQEPIHNFAQVYSDSIITDSINWIKIEGAFVADSAYNYLSIGNFFTESLTSRISFNSTVAYYYIDNVSLSPDSNYCDSLTNINIHENNNIVHIFFNRTQDWIIIEGKEIKLIEVFDLYGNVVLTHLTSLSSSYFTINISSLKQGLYIVKIKTLKNYFTKKIILN